MAAKKKTWNKTNVVRDIGKCRYCNSSMVNTDSFVVFLSTDINGDREKAHYSCMEKDYYKSLINKNKDKEINNRLGWSTCLADQVLVFTRGIGWV